MEEKLIKINRFFGTSKKTLGTMYLCEGNTIAAGLKSLELPWNDNKRRVSCIPLGEYWAIPIIRSNKKWALWLQDVPGRSEILIHSGSFTWDTLGCILPGTKFDDINNDGIMDVVGSQRSMDAIQGFCKGLQRIKVIITKSYHNHKI